jgi:enterochelin esterase-like enzyme
MRLRFIICLIGLSLAACSTAGTTSRAGFTQTPAQSPAATPSLEASPTASPTSTSTSSPLPPTASLTPTQTLTPSPSPLACWGKPGSKQQGSLPSDLLRLPMEYTVYLPPCYDEQPRRRYPVLYLIHGQNYNHDQWDRLGVDEAADALIGAGEVAPFLIVLPRDRSWAQPTEDNFGRVVADELIPAIDAGYRTLPDRGYRAVGGLSRGAGWAVHLGLSRWQLFGSIGAHSLPVFWSDTAHIRDWLDEIPHEALPRMYLDIGDKDRPSIMESALWFENLLSEEGIPHEWHLYPGYHEEDYWEAHVEEYLRWYASGW